MDEPKAADELAGGFCVLEMRRLSAFPVELASPIVAAFGDNPRISRSANDGALAPAMQQSFVIAPFFLGDHPADRAPADCNLEMLLNDTNHRSA